MKRSIELFVFFVISSFTSSIAHAQTTCKGYDAYEFWPFTIGKAASIVTQVCCDEETSVPQNEKEAVSLNIKLHPGDKVEIKNIEISTTENVTVTCGQQFLKKCTTFISHQFKNSMPNGVNLRVYKEESKIVNDENTRACGQLNCI